MGYMTHQQCCVYGAVHLWHRDSAAFKLLVYRGLYLTFQTVSVHTTAEIARCNVLLENNASN